MSTISVNGKEITEALKYTGKKCITFNVWEDSDYYRPKSVYGFRSKVS